MKGDATAETTDHSDLAPSIEAAGMPANTGLLAGKIVLRQVAVHNLKHIDLDIPRRKLIAICGVSGSGKTSLALDTLYAEGQRRFIESFSAYNRQFLERLEKPDAERLDGIPPAIAVTQGEGSRSSRSTVASATELHDYLRLIYAKIGRVFCYQCGREVRQDSPQSAADELAGLPAGRRYMLCFPLNVAAKPAKQLIALREQGFVRFVYAERTWQLPEGAEQPELASGDTLWVVVDRLSSGGVPIERLRDSLETAFAAGQGQAVALIEASSSNVVTTTGKSPLAVIDGISYESRLFSTQLACNACNLEYLAPEPRLFSFNSPLGACPSCEGFGNVVDLDMDLIVPDARKSLADGAVAPWNTPAFAHELEELLKLAPKYKLPVDVPYSELDERQRKLVIDGVPERQFGGLKGFFAWLEKRKYKVQYRVYLSRWRSYRRCPACDGARLRPEALAVQVAGKNIAQVAALQADAAIDCWSGADFTPHETALIQTSLGQVNSRLRFLCETGLAYLTLDRPVRTLSGGESQRIALCGALGSNLVNMLYVLDEPTAGLHPQDIERLVATILKLRDRGNSVVAVEHDDALILAADQVIEIGPSAGERGGNVVFQGTPSELLAPGASLTGEFLSGRRGANFKARRRLPERGAIRLVGARGHNLRNVSLDFPLGLLCVVAGVSGSGKSTLVEDTLYRALRRRMHKEAAKPLEHDEIIGDSQIDDVILVDQSPVARSPRSNPVTYVKAFDEIREAFAETIDAKTRGFTAGHFSFNVDPGRCTACSGDGSIKIDMQFLPDVYMKCAQCGGKRYRREVLDVKLRSRSIADVLDMTVREAFGFFRGRAKVQHKLKRLIDVGLEYLRLGQGANTLSGGESQRLKLAAHLSSVKRGRSLFLLDEPTTGLHSQDVTTLLDCFDALVNVGHSLIVIEHNLQLIKAADYVIELGPGAAAAGGQIVAQGTPEDLARRPDSPTGRYLTSLLAPPDRAAGAS